MITRTESNATACIKSKTIHNILTHIHIHIHVHLHIHIHVDVCVHIHVECTGGTCTGHNVHVYNVHVQMKEENETTTVCTLKVQLLSCISFP